MAEALRRDCDQCGGVGQMIIEPDVTQPGMRTRNCPLCDGTGYPRRSWLDRHLGRARPAVVVAAAAATVGVIAFQLVGT